MLFNQKYNSILNWMFKNNREARHFFVEFIKQLPDHVLDIIHDGFSGEFHGDEFDLDVYFAFNRIQLHIWDEKIGFLVIDLLPITIDQVNEIPFDQENDIFLDNDYNDIVSPASFNLRFEPVSDEVGGVDYLFVIVEKKDGYYLVSQEASDAGLHCTKIDLEDFIVEAEKQEHSPKRKFKLKKLNANHIE